METEIQTPLPSYFSPLQQFCAVEKYFLFCPSLPKFLWFSSLAIRKRIFTYRRRHDWRFVQFLNLWQTEGANNFENSHANKNSRLGALPINWSHRLRRQLHVRQWQTPANKCILESEHIQGVSDVFKMPLPSRNQTNCTRFSTLSNRKRRGGGVGNEKDRCREQYL